jgi:Fe-S-cluster containining protein
MRPVLDHLIDDDHDADECYDCLMAREPVKSECRCGKCCHLLIEVDARDAQREPKITEKCPPILSPPEFGTRAIIGYLLNVEENDYACAFLDRETNLCRIYATRPLICRQFDCDAEGREQLIELGVAGAGGVSQAAQGRVRVSEITIGPVTGVWRPQRPHGLLRYRHGNRTHRSIHQNDMKEFLVEPILDSGVECGPRKPCQSPFAGDFRGQYSAACAVRAFEGAVAAI